MGLPILNTTDFVGFAGLSQNTYDTAKLQEFITEFESHYLRYIFNAEAYNSVRDNTPLTDKFEDLINGVDWTDDCDILQKNTGFKECLKYFIYYHYIVENWQNTPGGTTINKNDNATQLDGGMLTQNANRKYNYALNIYEMEVVPFINEYDFIQQAITGFVDNGGGSYTINTASTKYLEDGDIVSIGGLELAVSNIVVDTSYDVTAALGLTFTGSYSYEPFKDFVLPKLNMQWL